MSLWVVTESHVWGDEKDEAASPEDIENLQNQIDSLKKSLAIRVTDSTLKKAISDVDLKVEEISDLIDKLRKNILSTLQNGEWKSSCLHDIKTALSLLEKRFSEFDNELNKKMATLPRLEAVEEKVRSVFLLQSENMCKKIYLAGKQIQEEVRKESQHSNLLTALNEEIKNITWTTKNYE